MKSYRSLATGSRFLKGVQIDGPNTNFTVGDRQAAEDQAATEIDSSLATSFTVDPNSPPIVRLLADLLGSAVIFEYAAIASSFGEDGEGSRKPAYLRKKAKEIIDDLRAHKRGIQNADGSWNSLYPSPDILPSIHLGEAKPITIEPGLAWGQMAQPELSQVESDAIDSDRGRRSNEAEAALAGAYGL